MPGRLQLPGLWRELECLEVKVGVAWAGGWEELQHLQDHYILAMSLVSGS
jgi:hypothetical protein